jgi:S-adenosylmethionine:tRNA ribosyltransferase-isomerase
VVAVGTTVVRALESSSAAHAGVVAAGRGLSELRLGPESRLQVVDGILTGLHEPGTSHHRLLQAFVPAPRLDAAMAHAARTGYLCHEFGDLGLVLAA